MGVNTESFDFLDINKDLFLSKKILTIWRQTNYIDQKILNKFWIPKEEYTDHIWMKRRKVNILDSIDFSDYESPTYTHDFNTPISSNFHHQYDVIFDGGSSEHMFHIPQVFMNYHNILKKWWYYIGILPMNNHVNHGFYQFSPDFFYSLFSQDRGYKTSCFISKKWQRYRIKDLREFNEVYHANLSISSYPNLIYVIAKKIEEKETFWEHPKQAVYNDYLWSTQSSNIAQQENKKNITLLQKLYRIIAPESLKIKVQHYITQKKMLEKINKPIFK